MKFFHLSDLHIGLKLFNRDLKEDQAYVFHRIAELAGQEKPDAVIIAGDIYDKAVPSAEAVELFDSFISWIMESAPNAEIMAVSGNHDSAQRLNIFRNVLKKQHVHMVGMPPGNEEEGIEKLTLQDEFGRIHFYLLPFIRPSMVRGLFQEREDGTALTYNEAVSGLIGREKINDKERNVLVSHQFYLPSGMSPESVERMDSEIRTVGDIDEVNADILQAFDYAALGHIHKPMKVGSEYYRYCGTPLACSVSEAGQEKGIVVVEMQEKGRTIIRTLPIKPLREVKIIKGELAQLLRQGSEDYALIILTDKKELDVLDMQDRLRHAFPNALEIRRESFGEGTSIEGYLPERELDALSLCQSFLGDLDEDDRDILKDVINAVREDEE